jgi:hypothetical protein
MMGPLQVLVIAFPEPRFDGSILPELERQVSGGTISIVDGLFVQKDQDGACHFLEIAEMGSADPEAAALAELFDRVESLISDEDVESLSEDIQPGGAAAILVFEHTWAKALTAAVGDAGGELVASVHVPGHVADEVLAAAASDS